VGIGQRATHGSWIAAVIHDRAIPGEPERYPGGLTRRSWLYHQRYGREGNPNLRGPRRPAVQPPKVQPPPSHFEKVCAEPPEVIAAMPDPSPTQLDLLERLRREGEVVMSGKTARRTVEALVQRGLAKYEVEHVLNETHWHYFYRFTVHRKE
jgi:hypothetical protein